MFNSNDAKKTLITRRQLFNNVSQEDIFRFYTGQEVSTTKLIYSPLRSDQKPTCGYFYNNGILWLKDFGSDFFGDCIKLVCELLNISYHKALVRIQKDMSLNIRPEYKKQDNFQKKNKTERVQKFQIEARKYNEFDLKYWNQFGITYETLKKFKVYPVNKVFMDGKLKDLHREKDPMYAYVFPSGRMKIYRPLNPKYKWRANITAEDLNGAEQCRVNEPLFITSSMKDVMTIYEAGFSAVALQSEGGRFPKKLTDVLMVTNSPVILFYDNDEPGRRNSEARAKEHNLEQLFIPNEYGVKDPSDFVQLFGINELKKLIEDFLCKLKKDQKSLMSSSSGFFDH